RDELAEGGGGRAVALGLDRAAHLAQLGELAVALEARVRHGGEDLEERVEVPEGLLALAARLGEVVEQDGAIGVVEPEEGGSADLRVGRRELARDRARALGAGDPRRDAREARGELRLPRSPAEARERRRSFGRDRRGARELGSERVAVDPVERRLGPRDRREV